ncbi:MAG TPA: AI-2E family transporter [Chloroflexota bacterium]
MKQPNWGRLLLVLGTILASFAVLYIAGSVFFRFKQAILLFVLGAIVAYILTPMVNGLQGLFRTRWIAIVVAYLAFAAVIVGLAVMLFTPFIQQSQSLVDNLRTPASGSLQTIVRVRQQAQQLHADLVREARSLRKTGTLSTATISADQLAIQHLQRALGDLKHGTLSGLSHPRYHHAKSSDNRLPPNPEPQTQVPPSYVLPISSQLTALTSTYASAVAFAPTVDPTLFAQSISRANRISVAATQNYHIMSTTPIAVLRSQTWLDEHGIHTDIHTKFGDAAKQLSDRGTLVLDNAITILSETATILLDFALVLIIAFYFLNDGGRIIHGTVNLIPARYREQAWFFVLSLDKVVGGYIRGQLFLSSLAGLLGGGGAAVLGVPYPLLIGIMTFLLQSIPVIGPMVAIVPAGAISLFFMPVFTTVLLAVWFLVFQQIVTNIVGPRVNSMAVGIHPLEAILAVLVGYPIGGFLGAFLAVPVAGIIHIVVRELYAYFVLGRSLPTAVAPTALDGAASSKSVSGRQVSEATEKRSAAG